MNGPPIQSAENNLNNKISFDTVRMEEKNGGDFNVDPIDDSLIQPLRRLPPHSDAHERLVQCTAHAIHQHREETNQFNLSANRSLDTNRNSTKSVTRQAHGVTPLERKQFRFL